MDVQGQPEAQVYRNRTLMNFDDLCLIYAYIQADGRYSRSSHDIDFDDDAQGVNFGVFLLLVRLYISIGIHMYVDNARFFMTARILTFKKSNEKACGK